MSIPVYHASTERVVLPICKYGREKLDFGRGFYITDVKEQAEEWANRMQDRRHKPGLVNVYYLDKESFLAQAKCKLFTAYDQEWLEFICSCRSGYDPSLQYDYIEGGIADDRVVDSVNLYLQGFISQEETLRRLAMHQPNNQICLLNQELTDKHLHYEHTYSI